MTGWIQNLPQLSVAATILWKITLLLAAGWVFHFLLIRRNPRWRVLLWRGVIVGALLLPIIEILGPRLTVEVPPPEPVVVEFVDIPTDAVPRMWPARPHPMRGISMPVETPEPTLLDQVKANLGLLFLIAWGVIALALAARIIAVWLQVRRIIKSSSPAPNPLVRLVQQIAAELDCRRDIRLRMTWILSSPFLTGILRALIIIPKRLLERPYFTELPAVLAHEVAHLRTNDLVWIFLAKTFGTVFWFHPLAWKIPSAHSGACEEVCDGIAAEYVGGTQKYSGMLARFALELLADAPAHGGAAMISASRILKRLHVLKRGISAASLAKRWVVSTVCTGLIILAGLGSVKLIYAERQQKEIESAVTDSDSGKETTMSSSQKVKREGNKVWIEGVPAIEWGKGKGCTYTGAFEAAASVTPNPWSYSDLMGVSGLAFRVRWCNNEQMGWCPSTPVGELPEEQILIDKATGWRQDTQVQIGDTNFDKGPIIRRIVASIDRGVPVLIYPPNYNMAVAYGYENGGETLLVRDYMADFYEDKQSITLPAEDLGPMQVYLEPGGDPLPPRERLIQGLKVAARNWHREHGDGGVDGRDYWYGAAAYDQWIADLEKFESLNLDEEKAGQFFHLNWWNFTSLVDARNSVSSFLRENAAVFGEQPREALLRAATIYEEETKFLDQAHANKNAFLGPWSDKSIDDWTADVRRRERDMLAKAKQMDDDAIAEIEKALDAEGTEAGTSGSKTVSVESSGKVIPGMEEMDWGGSFFRRQDSFMACFTEVLRAAGTDATYADVMGLSGAAFKLTLAKDLCPSGVAGYNRAQPALDVFGYSTEIINLDEEESPGGTGRARGTIVRSIDRGIPVPYMDGEHSLVVGYRNGGRTLVCKPYDGGTAGYVEMEHLRGMLGPAWFIALLRNDREPRERRDAIVASLQEAVRLTRARTLMNASGDSFVSGLAAYESWINDLEHAEKRELNPHGNAYCYAILLTSRAAAAEYLRNIADEFEKGSEHLRSAADHYERVSDRLWTGRDCVAPPWHQSWTRDNRAKEIAIMKQNLVDEGLAIAQIEEALTAEGLEIPAPAGAADVPKSAMLHGVPHGKGNSNSYARGLDIVLNYLGAKADYDTIMGDTGQAFIIMSEEGGPLIDGAVDVGWWPIAPWGIKLRLHFLAETVGRELRVVEDDPDAYHADPAAHYRTYFDSEVKRSIGARRPVLAQHDTCFVVTGYDENDPPLLGDCSLREEKQTNRMQGYPWGLIVPGKEMEPMDRKKTDLDAIRHAVALGRDSVEMNVPAYWSEWLTVEGRFTGQRSFELWARALRDTEHLGQARWHANMVHHLGINRTSAVDYLRAMAERHPENVAQHLKMAAGTYEKVLAEVGKADTSETAMTSKTGREKLAKLVDQIAGLEAQAIDHLAKALEEYGIEAPIATRRGVTSAMNAPDLRSCVKREGNKVFIEGFENVKWGREPGTLNSVMYTLNLLMNHLTDESVTYDELMGISGAGFRIQIMEAEGGLVPGLWGPCPSSPHANCGFECSREARDAMGLVFARYEAKHGDTEAERKRREAIIRSIDRGIPALYEEKENGLIVGYFSDDESKYLLRYYAAQDDGYSELTDWSWGYAEVLTERREPRPERENHLSSLKLAVRLAYAERFGKYLSGFNAYDYWIQGLLNDEAYAACEKDPMPWGNAWCFENLVDARAAAARYLRSIKGEYKENTAAHLEKAADLYEQISTTLAAWQKEAPNLWELNSKAKWTKGIRESEADILKSAMDLERKAVAEIEKALLAEGMDVGAMHAEAARVATDENPIGEGGNTMKKLEGLGWKPMWTTHIGCLKGCLDYLKVDTTDSWLFGASGHAFALNIHEELCPSGPTAWMTEPIDRLAANVGVNIENLGAHKSQPNFESTQEEVWKKVKAAIDEGNPCFGWELDIPEYYVITGYNDDSYIFTGPIEDEEGTKPWRELGQSDIGVVGMAIVRPGKAANDNKLVRDTLEYALEVSRNPEKWTFPKYDMGLAGYDLWIQSLEQGNAGGFGNSYNAQVWSECRRHAVEFLKEAQKRLDNANLNQLFDQAIGHYEKVAENLTEVAETYPFQGDDANYQMDDMAKRQPCVEALKTARTEEEAGLAALQKIVSQLSGEE